MTVSLPEPDMMADKPNITAKDVAAYLRAHPNFLTQNPDILDALIPPKQNLGRGVVDFQFHAIDNLRSDKEKLKARFERLITSAQDNLSVQHQVHQAALSLIQARTAEQLLEAITIDLARLFAVDVVRLALESDVAGLYDTYYPEQQYSGICFVPSGISRAALLQRDIRLIPDTQSEPPIGFEMIFADCSNLVRSAALLRLDLERSGKTAMLAFGVRHTDYFEPNQADDLLRFLAQIAATRLDDILEREDFLN